VDVATQRADAEAVVALERPSQFIADCGVTRSFEIDEENGAAKCSCEKIRVLACDVCHGAGTARRSERKKKLAFELESGKPCRQWMCCAGAHDNRVSWVEWAARAVPMKHDHLRPGLERDAGSIREDLVDFEGDDVATRADKLGENGRVIACATTEMKNVVAGMDVKQVQVNCPEARLAIVETLGRIENDKRVSVEVTRIGAFSEGLCAAGLNHPRSDAGEALAWNGGERSKDCRRGNAVDPAQFFGERAPYGFD